MHGVVVELQGSTTEELGRRGRVGGVRRVGEGRGEVFARFFKP